ncbi:hypothetical protein GC167_03180 [bacterium]|nr:hypothetical protein [bacterium]
MRFSLFWIGLCSGLAGVGGCAKDSFVARRAAYLSIDSIGMVTDYIAEGTASHRITTLWTEVNNENQGVYELPALFPVLVEGTQSIRFDAGINENGTSSTRSIHSFLEPILSSADFAPGDTVRLGTLNTRYRSNATVLKVEDFEGVGLNLVASTRSDTLLYRTSDSALVFPFPGEPGTQSGVAYLSDADVLFEVLTADAYFLPIAQPVFLELNYWTEIPLVVGLEIRTAAQTIQANTATINPNSGWNKIYINLQSEVSGYPGAIDYKIFLGGLNFEGRGAKRVLIDNLKLVF